MIDSRPVREEPKQARLPFLLKKIPTPQPRNIRVKVDLFLSLFAWSKDPLHSGLFILIVLIFYLTYVYLKTNCLFQDTLISTASV